VFNGSSSAHHHEAIVAELSDYERQQVEEIAGWKSERPSLVLAVYRAMTNPCTYVFEKALPGRVVRGLIEKAESIAANHDGMAEMIAGSGVTDFRTLFDQPLETCDQLAAKVSVRSEHGALLQGTVPALGALLIPGVGGFATAVIDAPLLFEASLRSIRRIGHCYGFPLDTKRDRSFVLAILDIAQDDAPGERTEEVARIIECVMTKDATANPDVCLDHLRRSIVDDLPLEAVPMVGEVSSVVLNFAFVHQVDVTARRMFQERWLLEHGKIAPIAPSPFTRRRSSMAGFVRIGLELAYMGGFAAAFGLTFPILLIGRTLAALPLEPVVDGIRNGAAAGLRDASTVKDGLQSDCAVRDGTIMVQPAPVAVPASV